MLQCHLKIGRGGGRGGGGGGGGGGEGPGKLAILLDTLPLLLE